MRKRRCSICEKHNDYKKSNPSRLCNECYDKHLQDHKHLRKRCHECLKWYPLNDYHLSFQQRYEVLHSNICPTCTDKGIKPKQTYESIVNSALQETYPATAYLDGFIGKAPYNRICEIFKIRYEK